MPLRCCSLAVRRTEPAPVSSAFRIVDYQSHHQQSFQLLNEEWITRWFAIEEADARTLGQPQEHILDKGGHILIALLAEEPVGTCALMRIDGATYELAKMSVSAQVRGKGIGRLLGEAAIEKAKLLGATRLFLESNTRLEPAISLYRKLGFREITGAQSAYARCNIQMELTLS